MASKAGQCLSSSTSSKLPSAGSGLEDAEKFFYSAPLRCFDPLASPYCPHDEIAAPLCSTSCMDAPGDAGTLESSVFRYIRVSGCGAFSGPWLWWDRSELRTRSTLRAAGLRSPLRPCSDPRRPAQAPSNPWKLFRWQPTRTPGSTPSSAPKRCTLSCWPKLSLSAESGAGRHGRQDGRPGRRPRAAGNQPRIVATSARPPTGRRLLAQERHGG